MGNTVNGIDVCLAINDDYFMEPLEVWVKWAFPFLPRTGEHINGWVWIDEVDFEEMNVEEFLTQEGFEAFKNSGSSLTDWLFEKSIGENIAQSVSFMKRKGGEVFVYILVGPEKKQAWGMNPPCQLRI
jgi:hypothetical protein